MKIDFSKYIIPAAILAAGYVLLRRFFAPGSVVIPGASIAGSLDVSTNNVINVLNKDDVVSDLSKTPKFIQMADTVASGIWGWPFVIFNSERRRIFNIIAPLNNEELRALYVAFGRRKLRQGFMDVQSAFGTSNLYEGLTKFFGDTEPYANGIKQRFRVAGLI